LSNRLLMRDRHQREQLVSWFKRSRRAKLPVPEHPVYGLRVGMNRATLVERLGPPPQAMTDKELDAKDEVTVSLSAGGSSGPKPEKEWWLYEDVPSSGHDIRVVMTGGKLESVKVVNTRERRTIWSLE